MGNDADAALHGRPDWCDVPLGEVAVYLNGRGFKKSEWEEQGDPIIRIQNLNDESASFNYTNADFDERYRVRDGDLLFAWAASLGAFIWRRGNAWLNQHIFKVEPAEFIEKTYLYYSFLRLIDLFYAESHGSGMVHITKTRFEAIEVGVPSLVEQRAIVAKIESLFSELDQGVAQLEAVRTQLGRYRQSVLKAAFEGRLTAQWRDQRREKRLQEAEAHGETLPTADDLLARIHAEREAAHAARLAEWERAVAAWEEAGGKASGTKKPRKPAAPKDPPPLTPEELADLPEGSCWTRVTDFCNSSRSVTYGVIKLGEHRNDGVPTLRSSNVRRLRLELDGVKRIDPRLADEYDRTFLSGGEVLVTVRGTLGGVVVVPHSCRGYNISREVAMLPISGSLMPEFLAYFIASPWSEAWLRQRLKGIAYTGINIETLKLLPVPLEGVDNQRDIVNEIDARLSVVDAVERTIAAALKQAEALRQSILKKAFEGRLLSEDELAAVRADPAYEPAGQLLARIREANADTPSKKKTRRKRKAAEAKP